MALPRFFCPMPLSLGVTVTLPRTVASHAGRSLRLRENDQICLFNGEGGQFIARLFFEDAIAKAQLLEFDANNYLPDVDIRLLQGLPQGDKMEWIIEKTSELGVRSLVPIQADRSVVNLKDPKRQDKRLQRWQNISLAAAEQCGRNLPLQIHAVTTLKEWLPQETGRHLLLCQPDAADTLGEVISHLKGAAFDVLIGPEGGWSASEQALIMAAPQAHAIRWGQLVLRTETAGLVLSSSILTLLEQSD
ncbi:16S rRNA (uracil(1498)-N(3))-methyltransferase [Brackiella oedipodis]|uniref:16S rRNA (uracil(1498)-N(3))-methyltransferase n=1 Tax=Brackiella oedipodis TaxID=124225 RepID=UPI00048CC9B4|nr:16S rRNA (uracil(1498)-N(3))-methyltransferase [Brackiella oedipodis]